MRNILEPNQTISLKAITIWKIQYMISHISTLLLLCSFLLVAHYFNWDLWAIIVLYISIAMMICKTIYMTMIHPSSLQKSWGYQIDEAFVQARHGVLHIHHTVIPTDKVQAVHISRLKKFGLANIIIQAKTTTIQIPAIPLSKAEQLKNTIDLFSKTQKDDNVEQRAHTKPIVHYNESWKNITLLFMTSLYISLLLILLLLIYVKLNQIFLFETYTTTQLYTISWSSIIIGTVTFFFIVCMISALYHYFTCRTYKITADDTYIYLKKDGISPIHMPIHKSEIKGMLVEIPWFKKPFRLAQAKLIYKNSVEKDPSKKTDILFPFISIHNVYEKIEELLPNQQVTLEAPKKTSTNEAYFAEFIQPHYLLVMITFLFMFFWPEYWFIPVIYALYIIIKKALKVRQQQYFLASNFIHVKRGGFSSTTWTLKQDAIDTITFDQTWIQHKLGLVSIIITSKTYPVYTIQLEHVHETIALDIFDWYTNT